MSSNNKNNNTGNTKSRYRLVASNRKAKFDYHILETFEAGIVLLGSEVKSIRDGKVNINDAFVVENKEELFLLHSNIAEYKGANRFNHEPTRGRKLLMKKKEINRLIGKVKVKGLSIVPLSLYFNEKNIVKLQVALVQGKQAFDKRQTIKEREWNRSKQRIMKQG